MNMIYERDSEYGLNESIDRLNKELINAKFGVLWAFNFKDKFDEKGLDYQENFWIFEVCNPPKAHEVLLKEKRAGYLLPCKMAIYEHKDGIKIGMTKPTALIQSLSSDDTLYQLALEVEKTLKSVIDVVVLK